MSLIVACPNCQTRYNLPEKFRGKKIKCKSCGKPFAATESATRAKSTNTNQVAPQQQTIDPQELAKMGIGAIRQQPDPFAAPVDLGPDPLRNHVVQDPGFGNTSPAGMPGQTAQAEEDSDIDPDFQAVLANPYIKAPKSSSRAVPDQADEESGKGNKKRKKKVHAAVKNSLDRATMTLLLLGVVIALLFGFFFFSAPGDALANIKNANKADVAAGGVALTAAEMDEKATTQSATRRLITGIGILIGVVFMILAAGVQIFPITCSILGLAVYVIFELAFCIVLLDFLSLTGWIRRVVVCTALGKAFMDAMNAKYYNQMMEERRKNGK